MSNEMGHQELEFECKCGHCFNISFYGFTEEIRFCPFCGMLLDRGDK